MKKIILPLVILTTIFGCVSKQRESELLDEIKKLELQLDDCINGAEKLHSRMKSSFDKQDYAECKIIYSEMEKRHPENELFLEVKTLYDKILKIEKVKAEKERLIAEKEKQEKLKALRKLRKKHDDVSGITWYKQSYFTHYTNTNLTSIYMGDDGTKIWLRLMMSYEGEDWIFFEHAYLSYDGNTMEIIFDEYDDKKSDNGGGVWEWIDVNITSDVEAFLREFAKSKNAKMRLSGKYTRTRNLTWNERQGIIDVLNGYDALNQGMK